MKYHAPHSIEHCRGVAGNCRNALALPQNLLERLEQTLEQSAWVRHLRERCSAGLRPHHTLRVSVSACANGCSRPQTADMGLLAALEPLAPAACSCCGACAEACPDGLVRLQAAQDGCAPVIDLADCLSCGLCVRACAEQSMTAGAVGVRVQLGGKLGRRPLLAAELDGIQSGDAAVQALQRSLDELHNCSWNAKNPSVFRLAELRRRGGLAWVEEAACAP